MNQGYGKHEFSYCKGDSVERFPRSSKQISERFTAVKNGLCPFCQNPKTDPEYNKYPHLRRILWIHFRMFYMKGFVKRVSIRGLPCKNCTQQSRYGTSFAIIPGKKKEKTKERVA